MIVQLENPKTSTGYLELVRERNPAAGTRSEQKVRSRLHLQNHQKGKYLGMNLAKDSDKTQLQEMKEGYINGNSSRVCALRWTYSPK